MLLGALLSRPGAAQTTRAWSLDDRIVIGDWTRVSAVAAGPDRAYFASPEGVLVYRPIERRWEGAYDPPAAGSLDQVVSGMLDPLDYTLWLRLPDGWAHFQADLRLWELGRADGRVLDFAFDETAPTAGLFLRTATGWQRLPPGALVPVPSQGPVRPVRPATVEQAAAANPVLRTSSGAFLLDPRLRTARYTAAAPSFDRRGWFLGTDGVGALFLENGSLSPLRLTFGIGGSVVGALHAVPGGVWAVTNAVDGQPASLSFVAADLSAFSIGYGPAATGYSFLSARRLIGVGDALWAATDAGVYRFPAADPQMFTRYDVSNGLPDRRVASLASRRGVVFAATRRGLARFVDTATIEPLAPTYVYQALAVLAGQDTVWVGTENGPRAAVADRPELFRPAGVEASAALARPVVDLAWLGDTLVGLTQDQFLWRLPGGEEWQLGAPISGMLGILRRMAADGDGFWVAGDAGVGWSRLDGAPIRPLLVGGDLPGIPLDLAVDPTFLWVATTNGLVRFRLSEVRP